MQSKRIGERTDVEILGDQITITQGVDEVRITREEYDEIVCFIDEVIERGE